MLCILYRPFSSAALFTVDAYLLPCFRYRHLPSFSKVAVPAFHNAAEGVLHRSSTKPASGVCVTDPVRALCGEWHSVARGASGTRMLHANLSDICRHRRAALHGHAAAEEPMEERQVAMGAQAA